MLRPQGPHNQLSPWHILGKGPPHPYLFEDTENMLVPCMQMVGWPNGCDRKHWLKGPKDLVQPQVHVLCS